MFDSPTTSRSGRIAEASDQPMTTTPRDRRHAETRAEILAAAWELAREDGLVATSLRELGRRVGLKASSLYSYFESKADLFDAMFRQGYVDLLDAANEWSVADAEQLDGREPLAHASREFFLFCRQDPVRYQLLFQRTVPGWEPSTESYALAIAYLDQLRSMLASVGITDERAVDMWTAIMTGLTSQQLSNDPTGDRWFRLVDDATAMFFAHFPPDESDPREESP